MSEVKHRCFQYGQSSEFIGPVTTTSTPVLAVSSHTVIPATVVGGLPNVTIYDSISYIPVELRDFISYIPVELRDSISTMKRWPFKLGKLYNTH